MTERQRHPDAERWKEYGLWRKRARQTYPDGPLWLSYKKLSTDGRKLADGSKLLFRLTDEEAQEIQDQPCWICKAPPPSTLDRHDNARHYDKDNTRPLCKSHNSSKGDIPIHEVDAWAAKQRERLAAEKQTREEGVDWYDIHSGLATDGYGKTLQPPVQYIFP